jgi:hypothetical protein
VDGGDEDDESTGAGGVVLILFCGDWYDSIRWRQSQSQPYPTLNLRHGLHGMRTLP